MLSAGSFSFSPQIPGLGPEQKSVVQLLIIEKVLTSNYQTTTSYLPIIPLSLIAASILSALLSSDKPADSQSDTSPAPLSSLLKAFNLCLASTVISITSVLNFSLAALTAILLGVPLSISSPTTGIISKMVKSYLMLLSSVPWFLLAYPISQSIWDWHVLGTWFAPFVCVVYFPLILQAMVVCMLDP